MGIKGLLVYLKKSFKINEHTVNISEFKYKKIGVDMNLLINKIFTTNTNTDNSIKILLLKLKNITNLGFDLYLIFDGNEHLDIKSNTIDKRKKNENILSEKLIDLNTNLSIQKKKLLINKINKIINKKSQITKSVKKITIEENNDCNDILNQINNDNINKEWLDLFISDLSEKNYINEFDLIWDLNLNLITNKLLSLNNEIIINYFEEKINDIPDFKFLSELTDKKNKKENQLHKPKQNDFETIIDLLKKNDFKVFQSKSDGDLLLGKMLKEGIIESIYSSDSDFLVFGSPYLITNILPSEKKITYYDLSEILEKTNLNQNQFRKFAILLGTDFSQNIPGFGPARTLKLIKNSSETEINNHCIDCENFNIVESYFKIEDRFDFDILKN